MENTFSFTPSRKRSQNFQESPLILNSFQSKRHYKPSFPQTLSKKPILTPIRERLSDVILPRINPSPKPLNRYKKFPFFVSGKKKAIQENYWHYCILPGGNQNLTKPMREIALTTNIFEEQFNLEDFPMD